VQEADHPQRIERTEEEERRTAREFGEIGENRDFTSLRKKPKTYLRISSNRSQKPTLLRFSS
jgi:hypothetical protein